MDSGGDSRRNTVHLIRTCARLAHALPRSHVAAVVAAQVWRNHLAQATFCSKMEYFAPPP
jgi:hypothetical protein